MVLEDDEGGTFIGDPPVVLEVITGCVVTVLVDSVAGSDTAVVVAGEVYGSNIDIVALETGLVLVVSTACTTTKHEIL